MCKVCQLYIVPKMIYYEYNVRFLLSIKKIISIYFVICIDKSNVLVDEKDLFSIVIWIANHLKGKSVSC